MQETSLGGGEGILSLAEEVVKGDDLADMSNGS